MKRSAELGHIGLLDEPTLLQAIARIQNFASVIQNGETDRALSQIYGAAIWAECETLLKHVSSEDS